MWWQGAEQLAEDDAMSQWDKIDPKVLKCIPAPVSHFHKITTNEFSVFGSPSQPDYATLTLEFNILKGKSCPELKSLKMYLLQYRECVMSYERAAAVLHKHLLEVYSPANLNIKMDFSPRGGLSSQICI